jgi:inner membrane protein
MANTSVKSTIGTNKAPLIRVLGMGLLVILLQIPILKIDGLIGERRATRDNAVAEVTQKWGEQQTLKGPQIIVPYLVDVKRPQGTAWIIEPEERYAVFLPERFDAGVKIQSEVRYRSIYGIPLYRARILLIGEFDRGKMEAAAGSRNLQWEKAQLVIAISDPKSVKGETSLQFNGRTIALEPGTGRGLTGQNGFHAPLTLAAANGKSKFQISIEMGGSDGFYVAPVGRHSSIRIDSNWADPSFQGNWLPTQRTVTDQGFNAVWEIPFLGRNYPQSWFEHCDRYEQKMQESVVGVDLAFPLDTYGKTERSIKYELIFIGLTFIGFWLFEILSGVRIHPMQYLLVGGAICLFYLLLLSLAEHIGFLGAYFMAAFMVVSLVTVYARNVLKNSGRAGLVGGGMTALYLYLLALLQEQEYSLLAGSIGLFVILALIMFLTRNISWYTAPEEKPVEESAE